ncbi:ArnT family glycosyltransferase, partial [Chloroflexota bacterium]
MSLNQSKQSSNRIIIYLALMALLLLGLWLRLRFIHTVRLYPDEFVTLLAVKMIGEKGVPVMPSGLFYDHGLLFSYFGSLASFFGPARLAVRYASLLFGMLTLALTFFIGRRWFSPAVGFIAATGLAVAPTAIHWSGRARMYALLQLLVLLTIWLAYEGVVHDKARWRWAALLTYLGATLTQFLAVALAPPLALAIVVIWLGRYSQEGGLKSAFHFQARGSKSAFLGERLSRLKSALLNNKLKSVLFDRRRWEIWLEIIAFAGILIIAFLVKRLGQPKGIEAFEPENTLSDLAQVMTIYSDFSLNLVDGWLAISPFYLVLPALIFVPFAIVVMIVGFWFLRSHQRKQPMDKEAVENNEQLGFSPTLFLTIILLATTLEMVLLVSPDRRDDKYLFMLLPVLFLLGAQGMVVVGRWVLTLIHHRSLLTTIAPLLISALILTAARPPVQSLLSNLGDDYDGAFAYIQERWQPGDTILTGTPTAATLYLGRNDFYSVQRQGGYNYRILTVAGQKVDRWLGSPAIDTETALHQTLANHNVWLVLERWGLQREYYDLPFQQQLLAQTDYVGETQGIFILRSKSDPQPIAVNPAHPAAAVFGDQVRLTGYTVEPEHPAPGQAIRLTLYWQALTPMPHDYTVFVHLREPEGGNVTQADHRPLGNVYPTTLWPVGETIRETSDGL